MKWLEPKLEGLRESGDFTSLAIFDVIVDVDIIKQRLNENVVLIGEIK